MWVSVKQVLSVAILMGGAGLLVATLAGLTDARIEANERARDAALAVALIGVATPLDTDAIVVCGESKDLLLVTVDGYGGPIRVAATLTDSAINSIELVSHTETPGFTDFLNPPSPFIDDLLTRGEAIDAVTGATVTANAVVGAVVEARRRIEEPVWEGATFGARKAIECAPGSDVEVIDG